MGTILVNKKIQHFLLGELAPLAMRTILKLRRYVGLSIKKTYVKNHGRNDIAQARTCSKSVLGSENRPATPVLFIYTIIR